MENLHIFTITTGVYNYFIKDFIYSLDNIHDYNIILHIFTDDNNIIDKHISYLDSKNIHYSVYKIPNMPYPFVTLFKFNTIISYTKDIIPKEEKFIFVDIDSKFVDNISEDINKYNLCFNRSSWISGKKIHNYTFSENNYGNIHILEDESDNMANFLDAEEWYCQNSFVMGTYEYFIEYNNFTMNELSKFSNSNDPSISKCIKERKLPLMSDQTLANIYLRYKKDNENISIKCYSCNNYSDDIQEYNNYKDYYNECFMYQKYNDGIKSKKRNVKHFSYDI